MLLHYDMDFFSNKNISICFLLLETTLLSICQEEKIIGCKSLYFRHVALIYGQNRNINRDSDTQLYKSFCPKSRFVFHNSAKLAIKQM